MACLAILAAGPVFAATTAQTILKSAGGNNGLIVVIGSGDAAAAKVAAGLGKSGDSLVHVIAGSAGELARVNKAIAKAGVKGCVSAEELGIKALPYRDYMVNALVIMDLPKAEAAGFKMEEARRCVVPQGKIVICRDGRVAETRDAPSSSQMDVWTHRYYDAGGIPVSNDEVFDLPVG
ncbi:MAG: hypothetical protein QGG55_12660, partial [Verrucomicrobiota bacterium]|nr:hypothetical protein [Verrucomicrobiota bacterium]